MTSKQTGPAVEKGYGLGFQTTCEIWSPGQKYGTNFSIDTQHGLITVYMIQNAGWRNADGSKIHPAFSKAVLDAFSGTK